MTWREYIYEYTKLGLTGEGHSMSSFGRKFAIPESTVRGCLKGILPKEKIEDQLEEILGFSPWKQWEEPEYDPRVKWLPPDWIYADYKGSLSEHIDYLLRKEPNALSAICENEYYTLLQDTGHILQLKAAYKHKGLVGFLEEWVMINWGDTPREHLDKFSDLKSELLDYHDRKGL